MRRLFFIFIVIFFVAVILVLKRRYQEKHAQKLLIEDILSSIWKEYHQQKEKSADFWLDRLRTIRERYGDEIAKSVADQLQSKITDEK